MRRTAAVVVTFIIVISACSGTAAASWSALTSTGTARAAAQSIAPPTSLAGTGSCLLLVAQKVDLTWTASSSTFATSYDILRSTTNGGPYTLVGLATGTTYTDTGVAGLLTATYYYVERAKQTNWVSVNSNQATVTIPCLL